MSVGICGGCDKVGETTQNKEWGVLALARMVRGEFWSRNNIGDSGKLSHITTSSGKKNENIAQI